jgi:hypothetical protein
MSPKQQIEDYKKRHPVGRSLHTGKWGFDRVGDCLNLRRCIYETEHSAKIARAKAAVEEEA